MSQFLAIPPLYRTCIYYFLGAANVVNLALVPVLGDSNVVLKATTVAVPLFSSLFLGVAAAYVAKPDVPTLP